MAYEVKVTRQGQTTLPKPIRDKYSIEEGDRVVYIDLGDRVVMLPVPKDPLKSLQSMRIDVKESVSEMKKEALETARKLVEEKLEGDSDPDRV
jgi:AbrB family looped-hinge helix DNA binding protein